MFQILKQPSFDFMGRRRLWLSVSAVAVVLAVAVLSVRGIHRGIEFTGGTEIQIKYAQSPDLEAIRDALGRAGIRNAQVTTIGDPSENEIYVRVGLGGPEPEAARRGEPGNEPGDEPAENEPGDDRRDLSRTVTRALVSEQNKDKEAAGLVNLNAVSEPELRNLLEAGPDPDGAAALAASISEARKEEAIFGSFDTLRDLPGMTSEVFEFLGDRAYLGEFSLRSQSYIGPAIGRELMRKAVFAILGSLAGMLVYIWIRFQFQWGLAAVVALTHDALITLGLFSVFGKEMSLPVVAAFLTLIGYSVNDTVVVLDRVRENLRLRRASGDIASLINLSINQTLSRTVITSGLTWIVVMALFLFGGEALNPFAFVLAVGVLVGTYSSIYVASPILLLWKRLVEDRGTASARASGAGGARKVRRASSDR